MMIFKNFFTYFSFYAADAKMSPQGQLANISVRQVTRNETISQGLRPVVHFANVMHCFSLSAWQPHISYP